MNDLKVFFLSLLLCLIFPYLLAEDYPTLPKREFRAVWVATFHNIDWPSKKGLSSMTQKQEFINLVDRQRRNGMNALMVQVRPSGDAFYPSRYAPWSEYLGGKQGQPPTPFYDPLAFMIESCHARQMEFHAWMNPFRAVSHVRFSSVADRNIINLHPEWLFQYGNRKYLNPGIPQVRKYLVRVVMEVVKRYDVDGIHFDDYFYPYPKNGERIPDYQTYARYGQGFKDIAAWRRNNIDIFIKELSDSIRVAKPHVKFGISPVGIWRNKSDDRRGSNSRYYMTSYDMLHADVRRWLEQGWLDYVAPQLYWNIQHPRADYAQLLPWWARNSFGRHVYIGQALFRLKNPDSNVWRDPRELPTQLQLNLSHPEVKGSIFYSENSFRTNPLGFQDLLQKQRYRYPALIPSMSWKDSIPPLAPQGLAVSEDPGGYARLNWEPPVAAADGQSAHYYVVYRFRQDAKVNLKDAKHIIGITKSTGFTDQTRDNRAHYTYLVTSVDRLHNESRACAAGFLQASH